MPPNSSDVPINFINTSPSLVSSYMKRYSVSYPGTQKVTLENYCKNGDGDCLKKANESIASDSYPTTDSSSDDTLSIFKWNLNTENCNTEEKNASQQENRSDVLLKYLKNANLNLKPEPIEHTEDVSRSFQSNTYSYPDFLPPPYNTLDLQKLALSKWDDWKLSFDPPLENSLDKLIARLIEMERLQHLTIVRERTREPSFSPIMAVNNRPNSTKGIPQLKHLKPSDFSCPQTGFEGDLHSFGSSMQESEISKCTCQRCQSKWNHGASASLSSITKHFRAPCSRTPAIFDSSNVIARRSLSYSGSSPKIRSTAKMTTPSTIVTCSLPDNESSKYKQPRTKRKPCRKNVTLMSKPFHSLAKQKYTHVDHQ